MTDEEFEKAQAKARRQTMFTKSGGIKAPGSYKKRSICNVHLILAAEISKADLPEEDRQKMIILLNEAYRLGKRMATKLNFYGESPERT